MVSTLAAESHTDAVLLPSDGSFVSLLTNPTVTVTGSGNPVQITAYLYGVNPSFVQVQLVVDGTILISDSGDTSFTMVTTLNAGTHTIVWEATSFTDGNYTGPRGISVLNLT